MGSKLSKEQKYIYECFQVSKYPDKKWKEFLFKFETKYFDEDDKDLNFRITYKKFESIFLSKIPVEIEKGEVTQENFFLLNVLRRIFSKENDEVRTYKIYILFFPFLFHGENTKYLDILELIFSNIDFFLLRELEHRFSKNDTNFTDQNILDLKLLYYFGAYSNINEIRRKTIEIKLYEYLRGKELIEERLNFIDEEQEIQQNEKKKAKIEKIHYLTFYHILYTFFQTLVVNLITESYEFIKDLSKSEESNDVDVVNNDAPQQQKEEIKKDEPIHLIKENLKKTLIPDNFNISEFEVSSINKYLKSTFKCLSERKSILMQGKNIEELFLTMEDVKFYFKNNHLFFHPQELIEKFKLFISSNK